MLRAFLAHCLVTMSCPTFYRWQDCPNVEVQPDFNISKYLGKWYYNAATDVPIISFLPTDYSAGENGTILFLTTAYLQSGMILPFVEGVARVPDASVSAKLKVKIRSLDYETDYQVLETDYDSFAVILACNNNKPSYNGAWLLTREKNPTAAVIEKANAVFDKTKVRKSSFH